MTLEKTFMFGCPENVEPTFGFTIKNTFQNYSVYCFSLINNKKQYKKFVEIPELIKIRQGLSARADIDEFNIQLNWAFTACCNIIHAPGIRMCYIEQIVEYLYKLGFEQYEDYEETIIK